MFLYYFTQAWLFIAIGAMIAVVGACIVMMVVSWCNHWDNKSWPVWPFFVSIAATILLFPCMVGSIAITADYIGNRSDAYNCADDAGPPYCEVERPG